MILVASSLTRLSFLVAAVGSSSISTFVQVDLQTENRFAVASRVVRTRVDALVRQNPAVAAPLVRLAFHDAATFDHGQVGGPNGSIQFELEDRSANRGLHKPLDLVQHSIRSGLSLADTIALTGAQAIESAGGPEIRIRLGRIDATEADAIQLQRPLRKSTDRSLVATTLPSPGLDSDGLRLYFARLGLSEREFVALSGVHGMGRHVSLLGMSKGCLKNLTRTCLEEAPILLPFVASSTDRFCNEYFKALLRWNRREEVLGEVAFIPTDVALVVDPGLRKHVEHFATHPQDYARIFGIAYHKLVDSTATTQRSF